MNAAQIALEGGPLETVRAKMVRVTDSGEAIIAMPSGQIVILELGYCQEYLWHRALEKRLERGLSDAN